MRSTPLEPLHLATQTIQFVARLRLVCRRPLDLALLHGHLPPQRGILLAQPRLPVRSRAHVRLLLENADIRVVERALGVRLRDRLEREDVRGVLAEQRRVPDPRLHERLVRLEERR